MKPLEFVLEMSVPLLDPSIIVEASVSAWTRLQLFEFECINLVNFGIRTQKRSRIGGVVGMIYEHLHLGWRDRMPKSALLEHSNKVRVVLAMNLIQMSVSEVGFLPCRAHESPFIFL